MEKLEIEWSVKNDKKFHEYSRGSNFKALWLCQKSECEHPHEWEAIIFSRVRNNSGCPFCSGRQVCPCNSLKLIRPDIFKELHPSKNTLLDPEKISVFSSKKALWLCQKSECEHPHEWEAKIKDRTREKKKFTGCPFCSGRQVCPCNSLKIRRPDISAEWNYTKNILTPDKVLLFSRKMAWWKCNSCSHEWQDKISNRAIRKKSSSVVNCPCNSLKYQRPDIFKEWHPSKNTLDPEKISVFSRKKAWWLCQKIRECSHEWQAAISSRSQGSGCPSCKSSRGEKLIKNILEKMNLDYISQKRIITENTSLYLDFYLPEYNFAIEFDGIQHFKSIDFFGGDKTFALQNQRDLYKNNYCQENKINLVRNHYQDKNEVEELINFATGNSSFTYILYSSNHGNFP